MFLIICSVLFGAFLTLLVQILVFLRWFNTTPVAESTFKPQSDTYLLPKELQEQLSDVKLKEKESCVGVNLIFQFLFQELKDTKKIRRWVMKRMDVEFAEMLQTTTGKILESIRVRDFNIGRTFPTLRTVSVQNVSINDDNILDQVDLLLDLTYNGGFQLAVDVDMVFGRSAYLSVMLTKMNGVARLQFSRLPYTHWTFTFIEEPVLEFDVESHFEGRAISQLASIIVNQIRRTVRKKHTLPNYKLRYKPFFAMPSPEHVTEDVWYHGSKLSVGHLKVEVKGCTRLPQCTEDCLIYCSLAIDTMPWAELMTARRKLWVSRDVYIVRTAGQNIGMTFNEEFLLDKYEELIVVNSVIPGSPADRANILQNDLLVSVNGVKVTSSKQAARLIKQATDKLTVRIERCTASPSTKFSRSTAAPEYPPPPTIAPPIVPLLPPHTLTVQQQLLTSSAGSLHSSSSASRLEDEDSLSVKGFGMIDRPSSSLSGSGPDPDDLTDLGMLETSHPPETKIPPCIENSLSSSAPSSLSNKTSPIPLRPVPLRPKPPQSASSSPGSGNGGAQSSVVSRKGTISQILSSGTTALFHRKKMRPASSGEQMSTVFRYSKTSTNVLEQAVTDRQGSSGQADYGGSEQIQRPSDSDSVGQLGRQTDRQRSTVMDRLIEGRMEDDAAVCDSVERNAERKITIMGKVNGAETTVGEYATNDKTSSDADKQTGNNKMKTSDMGKQSTSDTMTRMGNNDTGSLNVNGIDAVTREYSAIRRLGDIATTTAATTATTLSDEEMIKKVCVIPEFKRTSLVSGPASTAQTYTSDTVETARTNGGVGTTGREGGVSGNGGVREEKTRPVINSSSIREVDLVDYDVIKPRRNLTKGGVGDSSINNKVQADGKTTQASTSSRASLHTYKTRHVKASVSPGFNETFQFSVGESHNYLNLGVWCKQPERMDTKQQRVVKPEKDSLLGHISVPLMNIAVECLTTLQCDVTNTYPLTPSDLSKPDRSLYANLISHSGFDERFCYGDVTLHFTYVLNLSPTTNSLDAQFRDNTLRAYDDELTRLQNENSGTPVHGAASKTSLQTNGDSKSFGTAASNRVAHQFTSTHFTTATYCKFCSKKIWLKTAFQCRACQMVCHKKCIEKCQAETSCVPRKLSKGVRPSAGGAVTADTTAVDRKQTDKTDAGNLASAERTSHTGAESKRQRRNSAPDESLSDSETHVRVGGGSVGGVVLPLTSPGGHLPSHSLLTKTLSSTSLQDLSSELIDGSGAVTREHDEDINKVPKWDDRRTLANLYVRATKSHNSDEKVVAAAKKTGREMYSDLDLEERKRKLDNSISRLQSEIDSESERRADLSRTQRTTTDPKLQESLNSKLDKSDGKLESMTVLMLQYCAGLQHCLDTEELERQLQEQQLEQQNLEQQQKHEQFIEEAGKELQEADDVEGCVGGDGSLGGEGGLGEEESAEEEEEEDVGEEEEYVEELLEDTYGAEGKKGSEEKVADTRQSEEFKEENKEQQTASVRLCNTDLKTEN